MRIFDLYFSKRWSFLFPDACLTWRRLSESAVSPGLSASVRMQQLPSLARHNPSETQFSQQPQRCRRFLFSVENGHFFLLFVRLFVNLMMQEQTLVSCLKSVKKETTTSTALQQRQRERLSSAATAVHHLRNHATTDGQTDEFLEAPSALSPSQEVMVFLRPPPACLTSDHHQTGGPWSPAWFASPGPAQLRHV